MKPKITHDSTSEIYIFYKKKYDFVIKEYSDLYSEYIKKNNQIPTKCYMRKSDIEFLQLYHDVNLRMYELFTGDIEPKKLVSMFGTEIIPIKFTDKPRFEGN